MSYDLCLVDPVSKGTLHADAPHFIRGGTFAVGGTTELSLNVTYNYAPLLSKVLHRASRPEDMPYARDSDGVFGIKAIYGLTGAQSIPILKAAAHGLSSTVSPDYWECTEGNVKRVLMQLMALAQMRPDGVWNGD